MPIQNKPDFITFTGIDDRTDLTEADKLASQYPIEWGVLFSPNNRDPRFPCKQAVSEIVEITGMTSAHLCGSFSKQAQAGVIPDDIPISSFQCVQINGLNVDRSNFRDLSKKHNVHIVYQFRGDSFDTEDEFSQLYDLSAGKGSFPESIPVLVGNDCLVGYAGGMGPETISDYLKMIKGEGSFWIDMETRIRTNGWFDLSKVKQVCEFVYG